MPSPLRIFNKDPNNLGRGKGVYYYRGPYASKVVGKIDKYFSKYSIARDKKIKAKGYKINKVGIPAKSVLKHTGDGRLSR